MKISIRLRVIAVVLATFSTPSLGGLFGPSTYEDCILDKMKGVSSDQAARDIKSACRAKFPDSAAEIPSYSYKMTLWDSSDESLTSEGRKILSKLKLQGLEQNQQTGEVLRFHNGSRVHIVTLVIGYISKPKHGGWEMPKCPTTKADYNEIDTVIIIGGATPDNDATIPILTAGASALDRLAGIDKKRVSKHALCIVGFETAAYRDKRELLTRIGKP